MKGQGEWMENGGPKLQKNWRNLREICVNFPRLWKSCSRLGIASYPAYISGISTMRYYISQTSSTNEFFLKKKLPPQNHAQYLDQGKNFLISPQLLKRLQMKPWTSCQTKRREFGKMVLCSKRGKHSIFLSSLCCPLRIGFTSQEKNVVKGVMNIFLFYYGSTQGWFNAAIPSLPPGEKPPLPGAAVFFFFF